MSSNVSSAFAQIVLGQLGWAKACCLNLNLAGTATAKPRSLATVLISISCTTLRIFLVSG
jgi:hypothetical protein